jgi:hypothetical protein
MITRQDFLRGSAALGAALGSAGALPRLGRAAVPGGLPPLPIPADGVAALDPVVRLYPDQATLRSGDIRFGTGELQMMLPFLGTGEVVWSVPIADPGRYRLALCYSTVNAVQPVTISVNGQETAFDAPLTHGYYLPHPKGPVADPGDPDSDGFWRMREYYLFERVPVPFEVTLQRGINVIRLKVAAPKGKEAFRLRSIELTPVARLGEIAADHARALATRANTDWFANAGYGMWVHLLDLTTPRSGPKLPYEAAINALDVRKLAQTVADCGARYLIFAVNHGHPTCPAPIKAWERLHPGWTTRRDLIMELADALAAHDINLMLYQNCPGTGDLIQQDGRAIDTPRFSEADYARLLVEVFQEFGARYGSKVKGWWLDSWFQTMEAYPNLPCEAINRAIKSGYRDCMTSMNFWAFPVEVEWQDFWCGEITDFPARPFGARTIPYGPAKGLQGHAAIKLDAPWFHITDNMEMEPPLYTAQQLADFIRVYQRDQTPVTLGVGIYQDGSIGPKSYDVLRELRRRVRS